MRPKVDVAEAGLSPAMIALTKALRRQEALATRSERSGHTSQATAANIAVSRLLLDMEALRQLERGAGPAGAPDLRTLVKTVAGDPIQRHIFQALLKENGFLGPAMNIRFFKPNGTGSDGSKLERPAPGSATAVLAPTTVMEAVEPEPETEATALWDELEERVPEPTPEFVAPEQVSPEVAALMGLLKQPGLPDYARNEIWTRIRARRGR